jgi:threonine/homoserine/homoserine lactone efflux protein
MRLVVEPDAGRDLRHGLSVEQAPARRVDPAREQVAVRRDPERAREAPDELRRRRVDDPTGIGQGHPLDEALVEQVPELGRHLVVGPVDRVTPCAEVPPEPEAHAGERALGREGGLVGVPEDPVERAELPNEARVLDGRIVDRPPDQALVQEFVSEVEDALSEPGTRGGSPVVDDVRRQERDPGAVGASVPGLEVVPDRALVDDEHRPRVVRMWRIHVVDESGVEDLVDARHPRLPCANPFAGRDQGMKIVQDRPRLPVLDGLDASSSPGASLNDLVGLVTFAFVGTVSPGPNNTVLWASGMRFGFRRTVPHVLGTALGIGALVVGVAAGIGVLLEAVPAAELALKVVGSVYLLYVAYLVLGSGGVGRTDVSNPFSLWQAISFQCVNPKAWIFAIAAVGTFLPPALPWLVGVVLLTGILMVVVIGSSTIWAAGGAGLGRMVDDERVRRVLSITLASLLVASVVLIWV